MDEELCQKLRVSNDRADIVNFDILLWINLKVTVKIQGIMSGILLHWRRCYSRNVQTLMFVSFSNSCSLTFSALKNTLTADGSLHDSKSVCMNDNFAENANTSAWASMLSVTPNEDAVFFLFFCSSLGDHTPLRPVMLFVSAQRNMINPPLKVIMEWRQREWGQNIIVCRFFCVVRVLSVYTV